LLAVQCDFDVVTDIVRCRNKNASTAAAQMGMPVLHRPHALVLGSHEDDLLMTQGMEGGASLCAHICVVFVSVLCVPVYWAVLFLEEVPLQHDPICTANISQLSCLFGSF
jgi:hypothetical protein